MKVKACSEYSFLQLRSLLLLFFMICLVIGSPLTHYYQALKPCLIPSQWYHHRFVWYYIKYSDVKRSVYFMNFSLLFITFSLFLSFTYLLFSAYIHLFLSHSLILLLSIFHIHTLTLMNVCACVNADNKLSLFSLLSLMKNLVWYVHHFTTTFNLIT